MICQMGVPVRSGRSYRVAFWARAEDIGSEAVSIALSDTSDWSNCGLQDAFLPTPEWTRYEFVFRATRDCAAQSRLQIWFNSTGTLWLDDVVFEEAPRDLRRPGHVIAADGRKNLIPNASFECGEGGWGSLELDQATHWGGRLNRLFGRVVGRDAQHGTHCLRIDLGPDNQPVSYFDYYELARMAIRAPLAANLGYMEVEPGRPYVFSAFMRALAVPGDSMSSIPARLVIQDFEGRTYQKLVQVSGSWQRYAFAFTPNSRWCFVLAGPDLRPAKKGQAAPARVSLLLDALQLEQGSEPTEFEPRDPVEFALSTPNVGNVFGWNEPLEIHVRAYGRAQDMAKARLELRLTDFFGREVWRETGAVEGHKAFSLPVKKQPQLRGFLRLHGRMTCGELVSEKAMRLAAIPEYPGNDSRFGVNHAYPWPHLLDLCRLAGLIWVRDWSLKWQEVEPQPGQFSFTETDYQIDRPISHGLRVLGLLPFPASNWSSSAPASVSGTGWYPRNRQRVAYAPRDLGAFENYVAETVKHYRGRIDWWQCFNEPVYTDYALPRSRGYDGATYAGLVKAFARAARRADPNCRLLAGIGGLHGGQIMEDFERFFAAGALEAIDAVDIHHYPTIRSPEFVEDLLDQLNKLMDKYGRRKPLWLTEYGYYADDEPWAIPTPQHGFDTPLPSEQVQADYAVRWAVIMLANGVEKVFYHAGTCGSINRGHREGVFFVYGGQPRKVYAAQAVMAHLLTPQCRFVKRLGLLAGVHGYLFRREDRTVAVVWAPTRSKALPLELRSDQIELWDIMGRPLPARQFTPTGSPVYLIGPGLSEAQFEAALALSATTR